MKKENIFALLLLVLALMPNRAYAYINLLDSLAGSWYDLDSFTTINQCSGSPNNALYYHCSPAHLGRIKKPRFEGKGLISATDSVLKIADTLKKQEVSSDDLNKLFRDYNYSDLTLNTDLNYVGNGLLVGIRPVRLQGQFQVHNPNLPLASLVLRQDMDFHVGYGFQREFSKTRLSLGAVGSFLRRQENLVEASLVELAARPSKELVESQKLSGYFFDIAGLLEFNDFISLSVLGKDFGGWLDGKKDRSYRYLFLLPDKVPRVHTTLSLLPKLMGGSLQIGVSTIHFANLKNEYGKQAFATLSYYVGPLRILSGFQKNLLRTGLAIRLFGFDVNVSQEWVNKLETGRIAQPRFTLEITTGL